MIERVVVVVLLGISILFMLVVLFSLLRESLRANGRIERPRPARLTKLGRQTDVEYPGFTFYAEAGMSIAKAFSTTGHQRASCGIARKRRIK